jgi:2-polyprenyl-3-methyl-5-hydroxy-6-metoxy-1,4-benzoquinol methylase
MHSPHPGESDTLSSDEASRKEYVRDYFHRQSIDWNDVYAGLDFQSVHIQLRQAFVLGFVHQLGLAKGARVLEVGCGAGLTTTRLAEEGLRVSALDFAPNMIRTARGNCRKRGVDSLASFVAGDAEHLPVDGERFDLVVSMGVIGYVPNWQSALQEMRRVLKPGGHLIVTCPNRWGLSHLVNPPILNLGRWKARLLGRTGTGGVPFSLQHAPRQLNQVLAGMGFRVRASISHTYGPFCPLGQNVLPESVSISLHRLLQRLADRRRVPYLHWLGKHYIVVADKNGGAAG